MTYPYRSLDVFRGEAVLVDDDDDAGARRRLPALLLRDRDLPPPEVFVAPDAVLSPVRPPPPSPERPRGDPGSRRDEREPRPGRGVVFGPCPTRPAPPPPPPLSPPRAVVRQKQPGSRLLPRGHTFIGRSCGRRRAAAAAPKAVASRESDDAPHRRRRASRAWVRRRRHSNRRSARSRGPSGAAAAPPPPPLSPEKEAPSPRPSSAAVGRRARVARGFARARGGGPGGEKRVTFGEYLFRVAEGGDAVAVC